MCFLGVFVVTIILSVVADRYISPRLKLSCPLHASSCLSIRSTSSFDTLVVDCILRDNRRSHANSPRICCFTAAADEPFDARYCENCSGVCLKRVASRANCSLTPFSSIVIRSEVRRVGQECVSTFR